MKKSLCTEVLSESGEVSHVDGTRALSFVWVSHPAGGGNLGSNCSALPSALQSAFSCSKSSLSLAVCVHSAPSFIAFM